VRHGTGKARRARRRARGPAQRGPRHMQGRPPWLALGVARCRRSQSAKLSAPVSSPQHSANAPCRVRTTVGAWRGPVNKEGFIRSFTRFGFRAGFVAVVASLAFGWSSSDGSLPGRNGLLAFDILETGESDTIGFYVTGEHLGVVETSGRHPRILARGTDPGFSPAGRKLAFAPESRSGLWLISPRGGRARRLTRTGGGSPTWSPSGKRLAYTSYTCSGDPDKDSRVCTGKLYLVARDGSRRRFLADGEHPSWSSRGRIAFTSLDGHVSVLNPGSGAAKSLWQGSQPDWSPRADRLAFVRQMGAHAALFIGNPATNAVRRIYVRGNYASVKSPAWSPDGRWLAFANAGNLDVITVSGRSRRRVLSADWCPTCGGMDYPVVDDVAWQPRPKRR